MTKRIIEEKVKELYSPPYRPVQLEQPAQDAKALYKVWDSSATNAEKPRVHEIMFNGEIMQVTFHAGKPTELPLEVAAKFQKQGFRIEDSRGGELKLSETPSNVRQQILPDETIAKYDELKNEALYMRAAVLPGGENFRKTTATKQQMIDFLIKNAKETTVENPAPAPKAVDPANNKNEATELGDEIGEEDLANLIPEDDAEIAA